jgi:N-methylhydantoinase A
VLRIGIDVGGTFTDLFAHDEDSGKTYSAKVPTTVENQAVGVMQNIAVAGIDPGEIGFLAHGTTTGLNALIERKGARTGLITTEGFRDVLEIMRTDRASGYDLGWRKPQAYVERFLRRGVVERVLVDGTVEQTLDEDGVRHVLRELRDEGVAAIAVCLLHSYANPAHERRVLEIAQEEVPDIAVSLSSAVNAEFREFERTNTAVVDAYIKPIMVRYIQRLVDELRNGGFRGRLFLMQGSGGMVTAERACDRPIVTLSSGPAAGAIAAAKVAAAAGLGDIVTFDVGGTSTDVSLVHEGTPFVTVHKQIEWGLPARVPMIDVVSVGAGGGSIGWIDQGGALKMGPQSAGANPGPVCYGRGGTEPTLSDALLLKGVLGSTLAGGTIKLDAAAAAEQVTKRLAQPLGLSLDRVVNGMIEIAQANMANAVRSVSIWKGLDPRDLTLVAFGGAGGMVAGPLARMLDIPTVVVPPVPGNSCAMGTLMTNFQEDTAVAYLARATDVSLDAVNGRFRALREQTVDALLAQGATEDQIELTHIVDMRYHGQIHELRIPIDEFPLTVGGVQRAIEQFEDTYEEIYTIRLREGTPEFVSLRVTAVAELPQYELPPYEGGSHDAQVIAEREVLEVDGTRSVPVYERYSLGAGVMLDGPVILEEAGSTIWIASGMTGEVDDYGNVIIQTGPSEYATEREPALAHEEV